ncbi:MAG: hypothetical protein JXB14_06595 [Candidatus Altiarchaeota archaeon]|nr:hypothetical protein [Candidatus Altiarchaeota archaeon]
MDKFKCLLAGLALVALILLSAFFHLLRPPFLTKFLAISVFLGPGVAISYGLTNPGFRPVAHLLTLFVINIVSIFVIYGILRRLPLERRFENKILDKIVTQIHGSRKSMERVMKNVADIFEKSLGDIGFYTALALISFAYGVYVATVMAFFLRVRLRLAVISIAVGAVLSLVFWWYLAIGSIPFITPGLVFVVVTSISIVLMVYGFVRENKVIRRIGKLLAEKGDDLTKGIMENVKRVNPVK